MDTRSMEFAHDLKMPIQLIYSCVQLLEIELHSNARAEGYLKLLAQSADQLQTMLQSAMDPEPEAPRLQTQDVAALARSIARESSLLAERQGIALHFYANAASLKIPTNREKLRRILENLLSNALRFTPKGGRIKLEMIARGDSVEFAVEDNGCGIAPNRRARVFHPGESTDSTGHGLHIVQKYAGQLGGSVQLEAAQGGGCRFTVKFPIK